MAFRIRNVSRRRRGQQTVSAESLWPKIFVSRDADSAVAVRGGQSRRERLQTRSRSRTFGRECGLRSIPGVPQCPFLAAGRWAWLGDAARRRHRLGDRQTCGVLVGDGGSLFSIHALWTAAKYRIPSIFVCFVNHEYRLLKDLWCHAMGTTIETTRFVGMDFTDPNLDMQAIAAGLGARIERVGDAGSLGDLLGQALAYSGPSFLTVGS